MGNSISDNKDIKNENSEEEEEEGVEGVEGVEAEAEAEALAADFIALNTLSAVVSDDDKNDGGDNDDKEYPPLFECMSGMIDDLRARLPLYRSDWSKPKDMIKVINATFFAFLVQLIPALIFANLLDEQTEGNLATAETLLATGIIGVIYAVFAGQGLVLLGVTGPAAMLLGRSYGLAEDFNADYFPFFFWVMIWAALFHILTAMTGVVNLVFRITPFTCEIFEFFIAISFMYDALRSLFVPLELLDSSGDENHASEYITLLLGIATFFICITLHFAESDWVYFSHGVNVFLSSYNMAIAVIVITATSYLPGVEELNVDRVDVDAPWIWQPTSPDRLRWIASPLEGIDAQGIFGAIIPGALIYLLFFVDHNIGSILTQSPKYNLKKPPAYHWDFFVLGITIAVCGVMGIPPGNGLIPQAPLHTRALSSRKIEEKNGMKVEVVVGIEDQRWSALGQAMLMFVALSAFALLALIPRGVLLGIFFYLGYTAMYGNGVWARVCFAAMPEANRPNTPLITKVPWSQVQLYTVIQILCAFATFCVAQFTPVAYIFPALIVALIPFRSFVIPLFFDENILLILDPVNETEEEKEANHKAIELARRASMVDMSLLPAFTSFRVAPNVTPGPAAGIRRAQSIRKRRTIAVTQNVEVHI